MAELPLLLSLVAFSATFAGGLLAVRLRNRLGVLIAVPLFDLLPEAIAIAATHGMSIRAVLYLTAGGFCFCTSWNATFPSIEYLKTESAGSMLGSGNSLRSSLRMLLLDAAAPALGVLASLVIKPSENFLVLILAFFAGGFLYLGAGDLLPEAHERYPPLQTVVASLAGFALILVVVRLLNA